MSVRDGINHRNIVTSYTAPIAGPCLRGRGVGSRTAGIDFAPDTVCPHGLRLLRVRVSGIPVQRQ